jgi:hypothetical protein
LGGLSLLAVTRSEEGRCSFLLGVAALAAHRIERFDEHEQSARIVLPGLRCGGVIAESGHEA